MSRFGKNNPFYGRHHSKKSRLKISKASKRLWKNEKYKKHMIKCLTGKRPPSFGRKISKSLTGIKLSNKHKRKVAIGMGRRWKDMNYRESQITKIIKGWHRAPNNMERLLIGLLFIFFKNQYVFTGNKGVIIGGKCPDFVNEKRKKIIEFFGSYWHGRSDVESRMHIFKKYGYSTFVVWEKDLWDPIKLRTKLVKFNGGI